MDIQTEIQDRVKRVPARRWLDYSRKFGQPSHDCMTDAVIAMVVVANEQHLRDHGRQDLERLLDMGVEELEQALISALGGDEPVSEDDAPFPSAPDAVGSVGGSVDADGAGAGIRADAGTTVSIDGNPAV